MVRIEPRTFQRARLGFGNILILYRYRDMRLDVVLDFGYSNIVIWHKCCLFLISKPAIHPELFKYSLLYAFHSFIQYLIHRGGIQK